MALSEEARARRLEWRAELLETEPADDRKAADAKLFRRAARLARAVAKARPAFEAAHDRLQEEHYTALAAWHKAGRQGVKPDNTEATWSDTDVLEFRAARNEWAAFFNGEDYRAAVNRCRLDNWSEPSDEELMV